MTDSALRYMTQMSCACNGFFVRCPNENTKEGHLKLARETGFALNDFNETDQNEILQASYGAIYIKACCLKPILDSKEWIEMMLKGKEGWTGVWNPITEKYDLINKNKIIKQ